MNEAKQVREPKFAEIWIGVLLKLSQKVTLFLQAFRADKVFIRSKDRVVFF